MITISSEQQLQNFKKRHIVLTVYIIVFMLIDLYIIKSNLDNDISNDVVLNENSESMDAFLIALTSLDFISLIFLLQWKKIAFWTLLTISIMSVSINLYESENPISFFGFFFIVILFGLLQLKKGGKSGWKTLQ